MLIFSETDQMAGFLRFVIHKSDRKVKKINFATRMYFIKTASFFRDVK